MMARLAAKADEDPFHHWVAHSLDDDGYWDLVQPEGQSKQFPIAVMHHDEDDPPAPGEAIAEKLEAIVGHVDELLRRGPRQPHTPEESQHGGPEALKRRAGDSGLF